MSDATTAHPVRGRARTPLLVRGTIITMGLGVGVAADLLLRSSEGPGLNLLLLFTGLALAVGVVTRRSGVRPSVEALVWMGTGLLLATALVLRASPALQLLACLGAAVAFALPALRSGAAWIRGSGISDQIEAIGGAVAHAALGSLRLLGNPPEGGKTAGAAATATPGDPPPSRAASWQRSAWGVVRGLLLATPLLFIFGALFTSADAVFADLATRVLGFVDAGEVGSHLLVIGLLGWLTCGYLAGWISGTRVRTWLPPETPRPSLGILEVGTALALVDVLFAAFVLVQLRYLFGGSGLVEVTPGLTYAEYAREGFAQLVVATALVLPCLLLADWLLTERTPRATQVFRLLGGVQILLLIVVIGSAVQRLRVYQDAYGLTESRFYGGALLVWLTLVALSFAGTVLRGRRDRFAFLTLVSGYFVMSGLLAVNPDARITRANLARASAFDAAYHASLSGDAVPALIGALPSLPPADRCTLAVELHRRWEATPPRDWRSWNLSEARARRMVRAEQDGWRRGC